MTNYKKIIGIACFILTGMFLSLVADAADKTNYSWKGYPETAKKASETTLLIERIVPKTVRPNKEYSYELKVTNRSHYRLDEIILTEKLPANFTLTTVMPQPKMRGKVLMWNFGFMAPGQKEIITITGKATKTGKVIHRGNADLIFRLGQMNAIMEVVNPSLLFTLEAPKEAIVTEKFPVKMTFRNNGTATVLDAELEHTLDGLRTLSGNNKIRVPIGDLQPGDSVSKSLTLTSLKTGAFTNKFVVKAKDGVTASQTMKVLIKEPKLQLAGSAPKMRYVGNRIKYSVTLKNIGNGAAKNLLAKLQIPSGTKFDSADEGGKQAGSSVIWDLGTMNSGESKVLTANIVATKIQKITSKITATAFAATPVSQSFTTDVQGIPALLLVVDDVNDPVAVGKTETYKVIVTNQGSLAATGVAVQCKLEDTMRLVTSSGPTKAVSNQGGVVSFAPLKSLEVAQKVTWILTVEAKKAGDVRFGASVKCDQLQRPVAEAESTEFYE